MAIIPSNYLASGMLIAPPGYNIILYNYVQKTLEELATKSFT